MPSLALSKAPHADQIFRDKGRQRREGGAETIGKLQIASSKLQRNIKAPNFKEPVATLLRTWLLELLWCLELGNWSFRRDSAGYFTPASFFTSIRLSHSWSSFAS
ncbi:MAG TPA: hypothetical protein VLO30_03655, partial [Chthoniobacterales bacterium]|nr:hypothetical protein [Chthoniobacterales bacterium]